MEGAAGAGRGERRERQGGERLRVWILTVGEEKKCNSKKKHTFFLN